MKKILITFCFLFLNSVNLMANVDDAKEFAKEKVLVLNNHMMHCEEEGYNNNLVMDYQYHNGYIHGARDAYQNMLDKLDQ